MGDKVTAEEVLSVAERAIQVVVASIFSLQGRLFLGACGLSCWGAGLSLSLPRQPAPVVVLSAWRPPSWSWLDRQAVLGCEQQAFPGRPGQQVGIWCGWLAVAEPLYPPA